MADFPPITHVALTVRDLSVSVPWYEALLGAKPVLDELGIAHGPIKDAGYGSA
jgi:catechol 2,3-dioxygenase-like lactoylglutathione lyase family enzyme